MFVHEHQHFSEAALKYDIVGKEDNYKYLVAQLRFQGSLLPALRRVGRREP